MNEWIMHHFITFIFLSVWQMKSTLLNNNRVCERFDQDCGDKKGSRRESSNKQSPNNRRKFSYMG